MTGATVRRGALLVAALAISFEAGAAPQTFNTALPVAKGNLVFREQFLYQKASDDPSAADRDLRVLGGISVLGYGVNGKLALFGVLPYLGKRLEMTDPSGRRIARDTQGFGDAQLFARYTLLQQDRPGASFRIAPFAGLKLPTGDDDERDRFGHIPQPLQSGSGSWDPFGGVVATYQTLDYEADAQLGYQANTEANGFEFGDELRFDTSFQYRLWPRELTTGVPGFLYGVFETNLLHQQRNEFRGADDPDSGGTSLFLSSGLQYVTRKLIYEAIVQLPVVQNLHGAALEDDVIVRAGIRVNF